MSESISDPGADTPHLVEDAPGLEALARDLERTRRIALDIEANGMHAYREQACVIQVTADGVSSILDVVAVPDLEPLRRVVDRPDVEIILHGGDYDVSMLSRDHGFRFHHVFDTMIAATLLGDPKVGLADLVRDVYGVELDKRYQTVDWAKRPLSPEQIDYLHRDTVYLHGLREHYQARLEEADLVEEAAIEFRRLAAREGKKAVFDPESWRRMKGIADLDGRGRAILAGLTLWREEESKGRNRPPFKVLGPRQMVDVAAQAPKHIRGPDDLKGLPPSLRRRYGRFLVDVVRRANASASEGKVPPKSIHARPTAEEKQEAREFRRIEDKLRDWRRGEATKRKVPNLVVLPNRAMLDLVRNPLADVAALAAHPDIGPKRAERYGEAILKKLAEARGGDTKPTS